MASVNKQILNLGVAHSVNLQALNLKTIAEIVGVLNLADQDLIKTISTRMSKDGFSQHRLDQLLKAVKTINREAYTAMSDGLKGKMYDVAKYEADFQERMFKATSIPVEIDYTTPARAQLVAAVDGFPMRGALFDEWTTGMEAGRFARLRDALRVGFVEGKPVDEIVRQIQGTRAARYKDGILDIGRRSTAALVRTSISHASNVARQVSYQENEDILDGVMWVSTLDGRTSDICIENDGKVFPIDDGPRPPAHINCRSTTVPVVKSWKDLGIDLEEAPPGTRASMDGQVPDTVTYKDWLATQTPDEVRELLGAKRAEAFVAGDLTMDKFDAKTLTPASLETIEAREADMVAMTAVTATSPGVALEIELKDFSSDKLNEDPRVALNGFGVSGINWSGLMDYAGKQYFVKQLRGGLSEKLAIEALKREQAANEIALLFGDATVPTARVGKTLVARWNPLPVMTQFDSMALGEEDPSVQKMTKVIDSIPVKEKSVKTFTEFVLGDIDRHTGNFMIDFKGNQVVSTDYGYAFKAGILENNFIRTNAFFMRAWKTDDKMDLGAARDIMAKQADAIDIMKAGGVTNKEIKAAQGRFKVLEVFVQRNKDFTVYDFLKELDRLDF